MRKSSRPIANIEREMGLSLDPPLRGFTGMARPLKLELKGCTYGRLYRFVYDHGLISTQSVFEVAHIIKYTY